MMSRPLSANAYQFNRSRAPCGDVWSVGRKHRNDTMLKIWGRKNSINVQKVMWTVAELGVEAEPVDAGMAHGWSADRSRCTSSSPPCGQK
jgi:hypothetical protein